MSRFTEVTGASGCSSWLLSHHASIKPYIDIKANIPLFEPGSWYWFKRCFLFKPKLKPKVSTMGIKIKLKIKQPKPPPPPSSSSSSSSSLPPPPPPSSIVPAATAPVYAERAKPAIRIPEVYAPLPPTATATQTGSQTLPVTGKPKPPVDVAFVAWSKEALERSWEEIKRKKLQKEREALRDNEFTQRLSFLLHQSQSQSEKPETKSEQKGRPLGSAEKPQDIDADAVGVIDAGVSFLDKVWQEQRKRIIQRRQRQILLHKKRVEKRKREKQALEEQEKFSGKRSIHDQSKGLRYGSDNLHSGTEDLSSGGENSIEVRLGLLHSDNDSGMEQKKKGERELARERERENRRKAKQTIDLDEQNLVMSGFKDL